jgi:hypothetical protein
MAARDAAAWGGQDHRAQVREQRRLVTGWEWLQERTRFVPEYHSTNDAAPADRRTGQTKWLARTKQPASANPLPMGLTQSRVDAELAGRPPMARDCPLTLSRRGSWAWR